MQQALENLVKWNESHGDVEVFWEAILPGQRVRFLGENELAKLTGYSLSEIQNNLQLWFEMIHHEDRHIFSKSISEAFFAGQASGHCFYRIFRANGSIQLIKNRYFISIDESGKIVSLRGLIVGIDPKSEREGLFSQLMNERNIQILALNAKLEIVPEMSSFKAEKLFQLFSAPERDRMVRKAAAEEDVEIQDPRDARVWYLLRTLKLTELYGDHSFLVIEEITESRIERIKLQLLLSSYQIGLWEWNFSSRSFDFSQLARAIFRVELDPHVDPRLTPERLISSEDFAFFRETMKMIGDGFEKGEELSMPPMKMRIFDDEERFVLLKGKLERSSTGKPLRIIGVGIDVTYQVELHERLRASEKMAQMGEMASGIAHEISTPLAVVVNAVTMLRAKIQLPNFDKTDVLKLVDKIERSAARVNSITKTVRSLYQTDSQPEKVKRIRVLPLVTESLEFCEIFLRSLGADLKIDIHPHLEVDCRPLQMSQVIVNLLKNAADAIRGGQGIWIEIHAQVTGEQFELSVTDSGNGISENIRKRIFEPLFTTKSAEEGSGLGLSLCQRILTNHSGQLSIDTENENTRFVAQWPQFVRTMHS